MGDCDPVLLTVLFHNGKKLGMFSKYKYYKGFILGRLNNYISMSVGLMLLWW